MKRTKRPWEPWVFSLGGLAAMLLVYLLPDVPGPFALAGELFRFWLLALAALICALGCLMLILSGLTAPTASRDPIGALFRPHPYSDGWLGMECRQCGRWVYVYRCWCGRCIKRELLQHFATVPHR
jgi:hypothetical protein